MNCAQYLLLASKKIKNKLKENVDLVLQNDLAVDVQL